MNDHDEAHLFDGGYEDEEWDHDGESGFLVCGDKACKTCEEYLKAKYKVPPSDSDWEQAARLGKTVAAPGNPSRIYVDRGAMEMVQELRGYQFRPRLHGVDAYEYAFDPFPNHQFNPSDYLKYDYVLDVPFGRLYTNKEINAMAVAPDINFEVDVRTNFRDTQNAALANRIANIQAERERSALIQRFLESLPGEPTTEDPEDTVAIYFQKQFPDPTSRVYKYVFLGITGPDGERIWFGTGPKAPKGYTWAELLLWLLETSPNNEMPDLFVSFPSHWDMLDDPNKKA